MIFKADSIKLGLVTVVMLLLAGCSKISPTSQPATSTEPRIDESEIRAYCPRAVLSDENAFYTIYERGGEEDPSRIIYQVAIDKITRACRYGNGRITMEVAAAGRVVPGPKFNGANVTLPIYVHAKRGADILYEKTQQLTPPPLSRGEAAQFLFKDDAVEFEQPSARDVFVFVGFHRP